MNVYQAVRIRYYALTYAEYWEGFRRLFAETDVIAIGEPLVRAMAGLPRAREDVASAPCGLRRARPRSPVSIGPGQGEPLPGFALDGARHPGHRAIRRKRAPLPEACQPCEFRDAARRLRWTSTPPEALLEPDFYCPIVRGERPDLPVRMAAARDLPKVSSSCTTVVIAREPTRMKRPKSIRYLFCIHPVQIRHFHGHIRKENRAGAPSAVPRWSVEKSSGPAIL